MIQITYQKNNGSIIQRYRNTVLPYRIGDTTSMGWKVLNIEYQFKDKYYPELEYNKMKYKQKKTLYKMNRVRELCTKELLNLLKCILAVLIIKYLLG